MALSSEVTALIQKWNGDDVEPLNQLFPAVYEELLLIARRRLRGEQNNHTLNTHGLVHEAYARLASFKHPDIKGRSHFYALVTQVMRNILVDHAKARLAAKRGGKQTPVDINDALIIEDQTTHLILELEDALNRLSAYKPRWEQLVSYRFFGGFTIEETARELGISIPTANRDWKMARAWLNQAMALQSEPDSKESN